jgi:hypothetical protein
LKRLPRLEGRAVRIRFMPALTIGSGKLYSNRAYGQPVHAGTYVRRREIILDHELRLRPSELARILIHELFHFAWVRLGNKARRSYEKLLRDEWRRHARGELGWSAESRKSGFAQQPIPASRPPKWRDYVCESFCDTAAWLYSGVRRHKEFTLGARHRQRRAAWFRYTYRQGGIPI